MAEIIKTKRCSKCKQIKPLSEFSKHKSYEDGHRYWCKLCESQYSKKYLQTKHGKATRENYNETDKGKQARKRASKHYQQSEKGKVSGERYQQNHPERIKARSAVMIAIVAGKLPQASSLQCSCGHQAAQYHHHKGYAPEHWLDVIPICKKCHDVLRVSI